MGRYADNGRRTLHFPCFGILEDVNKERGTQMDMQFQGGFFQQDRLKPDDNRGLPLVSTMC
jgi:hypothetical protein